MEITYKKIAHLSILIFVLFVFSCNNNKASKQKNKSNLYPLRNNDTILLISNDKEKELVFDSVNNKHYLLIYTDNSTKNSLKKRDDIFFWKNIYDSLGRLKKKMNIYLPKNENEEYLNQQIYYYDGKIDYDKSIFFEIEKKDTLTTGRNTLSIDYYNKEFDSIKRLGYNPSFILKIITFNNEYSGNIIKNDTLPFNQKSYNNGKTRGYIGIFRDKTGIKKIKGKIHLMIYYIMPYKKDSTIFMKYVREHYFNKKIYIRKKIAQTLPDGTIKTIGHTKKGRIGILKQTNYSL